MKQKELILAYIQEHGSILPAKLYGEVYRGTMMGSELSKRCRELRAAGILESKKDGKFERYWLKTPKMTLPPAFAPKQNNQPLFTL